MLATMTNLEGRSVRECLEATRVSVLLECHPEALPILIEHGFTPLANPALRAVLAPTVTLGQALGIRGLDGADAEALLQALEEVCVCRV